MGRDNSHSNGQWYGGGNDTASSGPNGSVRTTLDQNDGGVFSAIAGGAVAVYTLLKGIFGGGPSPVQIAPLSNSYGAPGLPGYPALRPWESDMAPAGYKFTADPLGQYDVRPIGDSGRRFDDGLPDPIGDPTYSQDYGDVFGFVFGDVGTANPGWRPYYETAVLAGFTPDRGTYGAVLAVSGDQLGVGELSYGEYSGTEWVWSGGEVEQTPITLTEINAEVVGGGRYEAHGEKGSYVFVSGNLIAPFVPHPGISAALEHSGVGLGASDSALGLLLRPFVPVGSLRSPQFGYRRPPPPRRNHEP